MITDLVVIFIAIGIVFTVGYFTRVFIARNERDMENLRLRDNLSEARERIAEVNKLRDTGAEQYYRLNRDHEQLKADHRHTAEVYAQCETDLIVTTGRLTVACDELLAYGVDIRADWAEQDEDEEQEQTEHVEAQPSMFIDLTGEWRQVQPHIAGHTETWMLPSPDIDRAIADPWQKWNGFTPALEGRVHVPAQRDGDGS